MYSPSVWKSIILIPLLLVLPGTAIVLYVRDRSGVDLVLSEMVVLALGISVAVSSFTGLVLAELGRFSMKYLGAVIICLSALILLLWFVRRRGVRRANRSPWWWLCGVLFLVILSSILYIGRFEPLNRESDPRPYLVEGASIANRGRIWMYNDTLPELSEEEIALFFGPPETYEGGEEYSTGFTIKDAKAGRVAARYFPLYAVVIATSYRLLGLEGTLTFMNPLLAVLSLLLIMFALRRLLGAKVGLLAGLILAVNPIALWFARYPIPEVYAQLVIYLGIYCFALFYPWGERPSGKGYWGLLAALGFSLAITAKFDQYLTLLPIAAVVIIIFAYKIIKRQSYAYILWFIVPMLLFTLHGWVGQKTYSPGYLSTRSGVVPQFILDHSVLISIGGLVAIPCLIYLFRFVKERGVFDRAIDIMGRFWRQALALLLTVVCLFAYLVMPSIGRTVSGSKIWALEIREIFYNMSWYFTHLGMVLFIIGLVVFVIYDLDQRTMLMYTMGTLVGGVLFYNPLCIIIHLWFLRRFIPVVIPFMAALVAYAVIKVPPRLSGRRVRTLVTAAASISIILVIVFSALYTFRIRGPVQYGGLLKTNRELGRLLEGEDKVAIFSDTLTKSYFSDVQRYLFGVTALPLAMREEKPEVLSTFVERAWSQGKDVYLVSSTEDIPENLEGYDLVDVEKLEAGYVMLGQSGSGRPDTLLHYNYPVYVKRLERTAGPG